jgi:hypothetical protein
MYRRELPRIYELVESLPAPAPPGAYFQNLEASLAQIPQKLRQFRDLEQDLEGLDDASWRFLKEELVPLLMARDPQRGWQPLFDKLNQAKAYNYLKREGCTDIAFVPPAPQKGRQTPDLKARQVSIPVLCEVKTINISAIEAERRATGGVGVTTTELNQGFFGKLASDLAQAKGQMDAYDRSPSTRKIVYIIVNFDDTLHEYAVRYREQVERYIAREPVAGLEIALDIKPPFYTALT